MFFSTQEVERCGTGHQGNWLLKTHLFLLLLWMGLQAENLAEAHPSTTACQDIDRACLLSPVVISVFLDYNVINDKSQ
jgi:hypothetical protein